MGAIWEGAKWKKGEMKRGEMGMWGQVAIGRNGKRAK
jgi:hypothetical protein